MNLPALLNSVLNRPDISSAPRRARPARRARNPRFQPISESLEERCLLSASNSSLAGFDALQIDPQSYDDSNIIVQFRDDTLATAGVHGQRLMNGTNLCNCSWVMRGKIKILTTGAAA